MPSASDHLDHNARESKALALYLARGHVLLRHRLVLQTPRICHLHMPDEALYQWRGAEQGQEFRISTIEDLTLTKKNKNGTADFLMTDLNLHLTHMWWMPP